MFRYFIPMILSVLISTQVDQICQDGDLTCTLQVEVNSGLQFCLTAECTTLLMGPQQIIIGQSIFMIHYTTEQIFDGKKPPVGDYGFNLLGADNKNGFQINISKITLAGELQVTYQEGDYGFNIITKEFGYSIFELKSFLTASGITIHVEGELEQVVNSIDISADVQKKQYKVTTSAEFGDIINFGDTLTTNPIYSQVESRIQFCTSADCTTKVTGQQTIPIGESLFIFHYLINGGFDGKAPPVGSPGFDLQGNGFQINSPKLGLAGERLIIFQGKNQTFKVIEKKPGYSIYEVKCRQVASGITIQVSGVLGQEMQNNRQMKSKHIFYNKIFDL